MLCVVELPVLVGVALLTTGVVVTGFCFRCAPCVCVGVGLRAVGFCCAPWFCLVFVAVSATGFGGAPWVCLVVVAVGATVFCFFLFFVWCSCLLWLSFVWP